MVASPVLFTALMKNRVSAYGHPASEAVLVIFFTMLAGAFYFSPALILAIIMGRYVVNKNMAPLIIKTVSSICLLLVISIQSVYIYRNNLSLIYKGTGVMILCYLSTLLLASSFYKITPTDPSA